MRIELKEIPIQDIVLYSKHLKECQGFFDNAEEGVFGMKDKLNIRPIYQREFIYKDQQRDAVIETIRKNLPLNVLYWVENKDSSYEVLDGQQRLISIGHYISGKFSIKWDGNSSLFFHNLTDDQQDQILNYRLMVYFCEGDDSEKLNWFHTINIAGEKLTDQELKNAIYSGPWVSDAKRYFSKNNCPAYQTQDGGKYLNGTAIRQDYLETVIKWISNNQIVNYMGRHQHDDNAEELWQYFERVIEWVKSIFIEYRKEMKGLPFGELYNKYKDTSYDASEVEKIVSKLMIDDEVQNKKGIYLFIFTGQDKYLNLRNFSEQQKREIYEKQTGICPHCKEQFEIEKMEGDHITPWCEGGKTILENCQMLCKECNRRKGSR